MQSLCPTCNSVIDPQRAPVARIRGAKVVTFCSAACAEGKAPEASDDAMDGNAEAATAAHTGKTKRTAKRSAKIPARGAGAPSVRLGADASEPEKAAKPEKAASSPASAPGMAGPNSRPGKKRPGWQPSPQAAVPAGEPQQIHSAIAEGSSSARRRNRAVIGLASAVLLGGAGLLALDAWPRDSDTSKTVSVASRVATKVSEASPASPLSANNSLSAAAAVAADPAHAAGVDTNAIDPAKLYKRALGSLGQLLESSSLRLQRLSAMALARTGDREAIARLGELLDVESSPLVKVQIGYALARAGDERGRKVLIASLSHKLRDVKLDAARSLVRLGDKSGAKRLRDMLGYRHYKIGAAGLLALLGDKKGFETLRAARKGPRSTHEIKMRAIVALGRAGDATVRDDLVAILEDGRYQVGAASALAALGENAAIPALAKQLDIDVFRVQAALSLRRLGADVDLAPLASALRAGNDVVRVTAAEAILVLTGPITLSERD